VGGTYDDYNEQIKLYRSYLSNRGANGLWKHVALGGDGSDTGHWSTGMLIFEVAC